MRSPAAACLAAPRGSDASWCKDQSGLDKAIETPGVATKECVSYICEGSETRLVRAAEGRHDFWDRGLHSRARRAVPETWRGDYLYKLAFCVGYCLEEQAALGVSGVISLVRKNPRGGGREGEISRKWTTSGFLNSTLWNDDGDLSRFATVGLLSPHRSTCFLGPAEVRDQDNSLRLIAIDAPLITAGRKGAVASQCTRIAMLPAERRL